MESSNVALLSTFAPSASIVLLRWGSVKPLKNSVSQKDPFFKFLHYRRPDSITCALGHHSRIILKKSEFASVSSSSVSQQIPSVAVNPVPVPPPPSQVGSPLFWVGVGVAMSAAFSWLASYLKKYAMQQAFKTMMNQMNSQNNQNNNSPFLGGSAFPFPMPTAPGSAPSPFSASSTTPPIAMDSSVASSPSYASKTPVTVEIPPTEVKVAAESQPSQEVTVKKEDAEKYSFVDVSPEDKLPQRSLGDLDDVDLRSSVQDGSSSKETILQNGNIPFQSSSSSNYQSSKGSPLLSLDALEKMLEDPTVQKMVYPYLPEEMRNPSTFKWMLQNPQYRQQLEEMLNNMSGNEEWDNRMVDSLKNFDLSSPEVKQQFDQIGLSPEEVISKIMANPDVAMAFQNPKVQQAILDCSQNPMNISKYQNDREVMEVFEKISELFPGVGSP